MRSALTKSVWGMFTVLVLLVLTLPACVPNIKLSKPELFGEMPSNQAVEAANLKLVISAVKKTTEMYDREFVPPVTELNKVGANHSIFISTFAGCDEMRAPIKNSMRASQMLQVELEKTMNAILHFSSTTDKERRIVATGSDLIREMQILVALTGGEIVPDARAYMGSCEGRILSQLTPGNEKSMEETLQKIEEAGRRLKEAKVNFLATLN